MMNIRGAQAPPKGPKNTTTTRGGGRGGIRKQRGAGPARVDKDGDLVMGAAAINQQRKSDKAGVSAPRGSRGNGTGRSRGGTGRGASLNSQKGQAAIIRGLGGSNVGTVKIDGLKSSKAASNTDGGLDSLLSWLERKANAMESKSNRTVKIKKVCSSHRILGHERPRKSP